MMLWLAVAAGGSIGAILRYAVYVFLGVHSQGFPVATFSINMLGSFCIGIVYVLVAQGTFFSDMMRQFIVVGILGAFTTFSTFSLEVLRLLEQGAAWLAFVYASSSVVLGLLMVFVGVFLTQRFL